MTGAARHYEIALDKAPSAVEFDPNVWLLANVNFARKSPQ
jgi:hypothetical protein